MIKSHKEKITRNETVIDVILCDICKKEFPGGHWLNDPYKNIETEVHYKDYASYPDDYFTNEEIVFDICPDCFKNRLVPWLKSQGAEPAISGDYL